MDKGYGKLIHKEEKQVASKHTKKGSVSHLVKEIKIIIIYMSPSD